MSNKDQEKQKPLSSNGNTKYTFNFSNTDPKKDIEVLKEKKTITDQKKTAWTVEIPDHDKIQYNTTNNIFYSSEDSISPNARIKKEN